MSRLMRIPELEKYCEAKVVSMDLLLDIVSEQDEKTYWLARKEFRKEMEGMSQVIRLTEDQSEFTPGDYVAIPVDQWNKFLLQNL